MEGPRNLFARIRDADLFFGKKGRVWSTLSSLGRRLEEEGIAYAVIGGMALNVHGYERQTVDVDVLITRESLEQFRKRFVGPGYIPAFPGALKSFRDAETRVLVEFIVAGEYPGDGLPKPVAFPDPELVRIQLDGIWFVSLDKLIELKLASGMSAVHRAKDIGDVVELIAALPLPRDFATKLDASVRAEFLRLWDAVQSRPAE